MYNIIDGCSFMFTIKNHIFNVLLANYILMDTHIRTTIGTETK